MPFTSLAMRKSAGWIQTFCRQQQWLKNWPVKAGQSVLWRRTSWPAIRPPSRGSQPLDHPAWRFLARPQRNKLYSTQEEGFYDLMWPLRSTQNTRNSIRICPKDLLWSNWDKALPAPFPGIFWVPGPFGPARRSGLCLLSILPPVWLDVFSCQP